MWTRRLSCLWTCAVHVECEEYEMWTRHLSCLWMCGVSVCSTCGVLGVRNVDTSCALGCGHVQCMWSVSTEGCFNLMVISVAHSINIDILSAIGMFLLLWPHNCLPMRYTSRDLVVRVKGNS